MNPILAMPQNGLDLPLHLFQVLEEEYISLYGELEQETIINLEGRTVTSQLNWDFHPGHVKDLAKFQSHLLTPHPDLPITLKRVVDAENVASWRCENDVLRSLNRLLRECFYVPNEFRHFTFSETTKKLLDCTLPKVGCKI